MFFASGSKFFHSLVFSFTLVAAMLMTSAPAHCADAPANTPVDAAAQAAEDAENEKEMQAIAREFPKLSARAQGALEVVSYEDYNHASGKIEGSHSLFHKKYKQIHHVSGYRYRDAELMEASFFHATPTRRCTTKVVGFSVGERYLGTGKYLMTECGNALYAAYVEEYPDEENGEKDGKESAFVVDAATGQLALQTLFDLGTTRIYDDATGYVLQDVYPDAVITRNFVFAESGWRLETPADLTDAQKSALAKKLAEAEEAMDKNPDAAARYRAVVCAIHYSQRLGKKTEQLFPALVKAMPEEYKKFAQGVFDTTVSWSKESMLSGELLIKVPATENFKLIPHAVKKGETLSELTRLYPCTIPGLARANPRLKADQSLIKVGETLQVPVPESFNAKR